MILFNNDIHSHRHALQTLNTLYEFDDFMMSIGTLVDLGCGTGQDLKWWATRTTRDLDNPQPLNIQCTGIDLLPQPPVVDAYHNISFIQHDLETPIDVGQKKFDVLWCHNTFQYLLNPLQTLRYWRDIAADGGMLCLILPQTTNLEFNTQAFDQPNGMYFNWTMVSLIHALAVTGWDCAGGFFLKRPDNPWLNAVVYKSQHEPMDPRTTSWYDLSEKNLLPNSAAQSVNRHGYVRQRDLLLPWLDKSLMDYRRH